MASRDIGTLRDQARAGDVGALTLLGKRLLTGDGVAAAPAEAVTCLSQASRRGAGEATALCALLAGWGVLRTRSMDQALDLLQLAAAQGYEPSQRELRLLAQGAGDDWAGLRRQVDIRRWSDAPPARIVSESPRIGIIEGFASAAECDWLIERGRRNLRRAEVYRHDAPGHTQVDNRTNSEADYTIFQADLVLRLVRDRIGRSLGINDRYFEVTKLLHYEPGQHFGLHGDFQEPTTPALALEIGRHGQRAMTFLAYLNDDYAGGETDFPRIGFRFKGCRGDALYFTSASPDGAPDYRTVHAGLPPASGVKWLLSQWIRDRPVG